MNQWTEQAPTANIMKGKLRYVTVNIISANEIELQSTNDTHLGKEKAIIFLQTVTYSLNIV